MRRSGRDGHNLTDPVHRTGLTGFEGARAAVVNRTHRIVREQALSMREQRRRSRSLLVPIFICSALLLVMFYAAWGIMAGYDLTPNGIPDASDQVLLFLLWSLPISTVVLGLTWFRRRTRGGGGEGRTL